MDEKTSVKDVAVSWFDNVTLQSNQQVTLSNFCALVKDPKAAFFRKLMGARSALSSGDKDQYDKLKKTLPGVTFSGVFKRRKSSNLLDYTQLIVLDIDKLSEQGKDANEIKKLAKNVSVTCICFISPSQDGLKIVVRVDSQAEHHLFMIRSLMTFYQNKLGVKVDPSGKDISRPCFLSHDPDLYSNFESEIFQSNMNEEKRIKSAIAIVSKRLAFSKGRNNFVYSLACVTNKYGLDVDKVEAYCVDKFSERGFLEAEVLRTVRSAYSNKGEDGIWKYYEPKSRSEESSETISDEVLVAARSKLNISEFIDDTSVVLELLLKDAESSKDLAIYFSEEVLPVKSYLNKTDAEKLISRIVQQPNKGIDEITDGLKSTSSICTIVQSLLDKNRLTELSHTARKVLLWEYIMKLYQRAFEAEMKLSVNVAESKLADHLLLLQSLLDHRETVLQQLMLTYEMAIMTNSEEKEEPTAP